MATLSTTEDMVINLTFLQYFTTTITTKYNHLFPFFLVLLCCPLLLIPACVFISDIGYFLLIRFDGGCGVNLCRNEHFLLAAV